MQLLNPTMTLQTCLQARRLKQSFVSCSRVKRIACKRDTNELSEKRIGRIGTVVTIKMETGTSAARCVAQSDARGALERAVQSGAGPDSVFSRSEPGSVGGGGGLVCFEFRAGRNIAPRQPYGALYKVCRTTPARSNQHRGCLFRARHGEWPPSAPRPPLPLFKPAFHPHPTPVMQPTFVLEHFHPRPLWGPPVPTTHPTPPHPTPHPHGHSSPPLVVF
jgi:hypothetical protein